MHHYVIMLLYPHSYSWKSEHNYINPQVQTTVRRNDCAQNNKRENSETASTARTVILKIGVLQYITALQRLIKMLRVCLRRGEEALESSLTC